MTRDHREAAEAVAGALEAASWPTAAATIRRLLAREDELEAEVRRLRDRVDHASRCVYDTQPYPSCVWIGCGVKVRLVAGPARSRPPHIEVVPTPTYTIQRPEESPR
jgi:hypothetical protein